MRLVTLAALCLAAAAAFAQTPDPTPPSAYYPLGIGDVREYLGAGGTSSFPQRYVQRESVVGDTLVGDQSYRLVERLRSEDGGPLVRSRHAIRFDSAAAQPVERQPDGSEAPLTMCRLDLPFGAPPSDACGAFQNGEPDGLVVIGSDQVTASVKSFANFVYTEYFAAGLGFVEGLYETSEFTDRLTFARIGGVEYGEPDPSLPPLGGEGIPDPTPPGAYVPLDAGNRWEYATTEMITPDRYRRVEVLGDTVIAGEVYAVVRTQSFSSGPPPVWTVTEFVRFRPALSLVVTSDGGAPTYLFGGPWAPCRLDLPFAEPGSGSSCGGVDGEPPLASGGVGQTVEIGTSTVVTAVKGFLFGTGFGWEFAAGIGLVQYERDVFEPFTLQYARVGGVTYGQPIPALPPYVAGEAAPTASALALTAGPNPTAGPLALRVTLAAPSAVTVEAFDALGRRVHRATATLGAGVQALDVDASRWAPGLYVVRVAAGEGEAAVRVVRR